MWNRVTKETEERRWPRTTAEANRRERCLMLQCQCSSSARVNKKISVWVGEAVLVLLTVRMKYTYFLKRRALQQIIFDSKHQPWNYLPAKSDHADCESSGCIFKLVFFTDCTKSSRSRLSVGDGGRRGGVGGWVWTWIVSFWRYGTAVMAPCIHHCRRNDMTSCYSRKVNDDVMFLLPNTPSTQRTCF